MTKAEILKAEILKQHKSVRQFAIEMYYQFNKAGFCALFPGRTDDARKE